MMAPTHRAIRTVIGAAIVGTITAVMVVVVIDGGATGMISIKTIALAPGTRRSGATHPAAAPPALSKR
jgi:hypothetical protein